MASTCKRTHRKKLNITGMAKSNEAASSEEMAWLRMFSSRIARICFSRTAAAMALCGEAL